MRHFLFSLSVSLCCITAATAADLPSVEAPVMPVLEPMPSFTPYFAVGPSISTLGVGLEAGGRFTPYFGARAYVSYLGDFGFINVSETINGINYNVEPDWLNGGLLLDVHPLQNAFRVTAGAHIGSPRVVANADVNIGVPVGGTVFPVEVALQGTSSGDLPVMPYLGLGAEGSPFGNNLVFSVDVGAIYIGEPQVSLRQTSGTVTIPQADLDTAEAEFENEIKDYQFYPVVRFAVKYRF